jgi:predicted CXXCH cytochrome family protein
LWNRAAPTASYIIYGSSTLQGRPGQPSGASKLCLSCHDGTIALGSVLSRMDQIRMAGGDFLPAGLTNLGTDLSDDHPVSFEYTSGLANQKGQLAAPSALLPEIKLDASGQLQCTACHDAHNNVHGDFLVMDNEFGALCTACHRMRGWSDSSHRTAGAAVVGATGGDWPYGSVTENACRSCHRPHTAGGKQRLLIFEQEEDNCLSCHDGRVARTNILAELNKASAHDPRRYLHLHDPVEPVNSTRPHVECSDCHNGHAVAPEPAAPGYIPIGATLQQVRGVSSGGVELSAARNEYEICLRCHGDSAVQLSTRVHRQSDVINSRLRFSLGNPSYHPIIGPVKNNDTVSLVPDLPRGSLLRCTDCHNNDQGRRAGRGSPDGPHGSIYEFLLERNYTVRDDVVESESEYALCYKCHQRGSILADQSFPLHRLHLEEGRAPCSACHDPHGVSVLQGGGSEHTHLINFDVQIVRSLRGQMMFQDLGRFAGSCTLVCHGREHDNATYEQDGQSSRTIRSKVKKAPRR